MKMNDQHNDSITEEKQFLYILVFTPKPAALRLLNIYGLCKVFRVHHNKHLIDPLHSRVNSQYYCLGWECAVNALDQNQFSEWVATGNSELILHAPLDEYYYILTLRPSLPRIIYNKNKSIKVIKFPFTLS